MVEVAPSIIELHSDHDELSEAMAEAQRLEDIDCDSCFIVENKPLYTRQVVEKL